MKSPGPHCSKKGSSMVEMVIIMPLLITFILMVWEEYKFMECRLRSIQATHYGVWQAVDGIGAADISLITPMITNFDPANVNLTTVSLTENEHNVAGPVGDIISFFNLFSVNQDGKMHMRVAGNIVLWEGSVIKGLMNLANPNTGDVYSWSFDEALLVDSWDAISEADIIQHLENGWLGPLGSAGGLAGMVTDLLQFLGVDVPRVNSTAVPPRE